MKDVSLIQRLDEEIFLDMDKVQKVYAGMIKNRREYFTAGMLYLIKQYQQNKMMPKMLQKINHL